jgi:histidinol dehydrogenase
MIRILYGLDAARAHVARLRSGTEAALPASARARLREVFGEELSAAEAVARIVADVRREGDAALRDYGRRIDGFAPEPLAVGCEAMQAAYEAAPPELRQALHLAAARIRAFHEREPRQSWLEWDDEGGALGQVIRPLRRVGIYVPGGTAAYPSSLLMAAVPAQVAGVAEIAVATPPGAEGCGAAAVLAAAHVAGVAEVYLVGGAQAIAALAYGTQSVRRVDKIVGAGGLFVTLAKKQVDGDVGIDGLYGPTETLLIADDGSLQEEVSLGDDASLREGASGPEVIAADLLAQAEHDPLATALLVTPSARLAAAVYAEVGRQVAGLARRAIVEQALDGQGAILVVADLDEALAVANEYAPEHLCLLVADPWPLVGRVQNAGGVFVGAASPEALGDYVVGPSHVMPTRGTARFGSPLHVRDFLKVTSVLAVSEAAARRLSPAAQAIARAEGLTAHAAALAARQP